jgi:hypothetical protein
MRRANDGDVAALAAAAYNFGTLLVPAAGRAEANQRG